jgi:hypothetical protein
MKTATLISLIFTSSKLFGAEAVKPLIGDQFGQVLTLEVEFVDKSDSYFDQNIAKARWNAKVFKINGKILDSPIVFEYRAEKDNFQKGVRYQLQGYEDVYSLGTPKAWDPMTQINYDIHHRLHLRVPQPPVGQKKG